MTSFDYSIEQGQLLIREQPTGRVVRCDAFETTVLQILPLPKSEGCLVLLDPSKSKKTTFENLFRVGPDGSINWTVKLPHSHDAFVRVIDCGDHVEARTWNGQRVEIDLTNGQTTNVTFVK